MEPTAPHFARTWAVTFPVGKRACSLLSVVTGVAAAALLVLFSTTLTSAELSGSPVHYLDRVQVALVVAFLAATTLTVLALWARRTISLQRRSLTRWSFLPAAVGHSGRLHLEKYRGECSSCGATLRFYSKTVRWHEEPSEGGGTRTVVDERHAAIECRGDESHWWRLSDNTRELPAW